jgi:methionyl aminopeptidase
MTIEGDEDLAGLRRVGAVVAKARDAMVAAVRPGVSTAELDAVGRDVLVAGGCRSAPKLAYGFPGWTCISVEDELAHGIPGDRVLRAGELVNVDVSAELDGYWADTGASVPVGTVSREKVALLVATRLAQRDGMEAARAGKPLSDVGRAVETRAKRHRLHVVRELGGHGVGRHIHEDPHVHNHFVRGDRQPLHEGLVLTVEPFLTLRRAALEEADDGWTLKTTNGTVGAQFEHTFVVTNGAPIVLT